ncbi:MAG TPA: fibronectin type III domain-containing protein [Nitrospira sp.]|nr:fibronectin type III domain-containing protein [Nitrospira sp.]
MLPVKTWAGVISLKSSFSMPLLILVIPFLMSLAGCSNEGAGGPMVSSLSTPTDAREELDSDPASHSAVADSGGEGEEDPTITMTSTPEGVTAHLTWDRPSDIKVAGYHIYYGKRSSEEPSSEEPSSEESSSEEPSSCSSGESQAVEAPPATITGLEPNTRYFFAIRAFNESESLCSNEITAVTPPVES